MKNNFKISDFFIYLYMFLKTFYIDYNNNNNIILQYLILGSVRNFLVVSTEISGNTMPVSSKNFISLCQ